MSSVGFGVQDSNGIGTTAPHIRQITRYKWASKGILGGLDVTGNSSALTYTVNSGVAVCSKGDSDGYVEAYFEGGSTPAVSGNSASYSRYDAVWITSHDITQGDTDNLVTLGVTEGTPAATPSIPDIPAYATLLGAMLLPAGATSTGSATNSGNVDYAIPYGASLGILLQKQDTADSLPSADWVVRVNDTFYIPTDRMIEFSYQRSMCCYVAPNTNIGSILARIILDDVTIITNEVSASGFWDTHGYTWIQKVSAGSHTVKVQDCQHAGYQIHYLSTAEEFYTHGLVFTVTDRGAAV